MARDNELPVENLPSGGQNKLPTFFAKRNLGGNFLNCYYPVRAPPRDKQSFNLHGIDNTSLLIHYCSVLYSNASKMRCFTCSSVVAIYGVSAKNFRQEKSLPFLVPRVALQFCLANPIYPTFN